jgi:hypothetical protein
VNPTAARAGQPGITADTTLGEIAELVAYDPDPSPPGERLVVETTTRDVVRAHREIEARARARRVPALATAATGATGYVAWGCAEFAAAVGPAGAHGAVVAGTAVVTALSLPALRIWFRHSIPEMWRRRWWLSGVSAAAWIDVAAATTPATWPMMLALTAGSVALSSRWLAEHRVLNPGDVQPLALPPPPPPPPPPAIDTSRAAQLERAWADRVAGGKRPVLVGAQLLTGRTVLPNAIRWLLETDPGSLTFDEMFRARPKIAAALGVGAGKVLLEPYGSGDGDEDDDEGRAWLTIVTRDLLKGGVTYTGPVYRDGAIPVGLFADGTGWADYVAVDAVGARSGLVTGDSGSGKSALLEAIAMGLRQSEHWQVLFADGDPEGGSSPTLNDIADWAEAGTDGVLAQLRAVELLIKVRSRLKSTLTDVDGPELRQIRPSEANRILPVREMRPCRAYPSYVWVIDELHRFVGDEGDPKLKGDPKIQGSVKLAARLERIVRIGRKYGVVLLIGTQSLLAGDFGGSTVLRANLATRNAFIMRSANRSEKHTLNGVAVAPESLPARPGYAFAVGAGSTSLLRVAWSETMAEFAAGFPVSAGDPDSKLAVAAHRPKRQLDAEGSLVERLAGLAAWRAAIEAGEDPDDEDVEAEVARESVPASVGGVSVPTPPGGWGTVTPIRPDLAAQSAPLPADLAGLSPKAIQVLATLRLRPGPWRSRELADRTGLRPSDVSKALGQLVAHKLAYQPRGVNGEYAATATGLAVDLTPYLPEPTAKETTMRTAPRSVDPDDVPVEAREYWTGWAPCPGCDTEPGGNHDDDCDHAMCPECGFQRIQCDEHDDSICRARWHGVDPAFEIADQMGWWTTFPDGPGGVAPDDLRVKQAEARGEIVWVPESQRYARTQRAEGVS